MAFDVVPGERLIHRSKANAVVVPSQYGLSQFAVDDLMGLVGLTDREAVGGHLHVTSLRLAFVPHLINRVRGALSIPLPVVQSAAPWRSGLSVGIEVLSTSASFQFVSWSRKAVLGALDEARQGFGPAEAARIEQAAQVASDLVVRPGAEMANQTVDALVQLTDAKPSWVEALSLVQFRAVSSLPPGGGAWLRGEAD